MFNSYAIIKWQQISKNKLNNFWKGNYNLCIIISNYKIKNNKTKFS